MYEIAARILLATLDENKYSLVRVSFFICQRGTYITYLNILDGFSPFRRGMGTAKKARDMNVVGEDTAYTAR